MKIPFMVLGMFVTFSVSFSLGVFYFWNLYIGLPKWLIFLNRFICFVTILLTLLAVCGSISDTPIRVDDHWLTKYFPYFLVYSIFFGIAGSFEKVEDGEKCHLCSETKASRQIRYIKIHSDPRANLKPICNKCFDERILSERWNGFEGSKWFDKAKCG